MSADKTLERSLALVHALHRRTRDGKVEWSPSNLQDVFECVLGGYMLKIREVEDRDDYENPDVQLDVYSRESGQWIESISNVSLRGVSDRTTEEGLNPYVVLKQTFQMARRKVHKVDDVLDSILEALDEDPPF